ncbi:hypothetical protein R6Q57_015466 [Mikania cordata]
MNRPSRIPIRVVSFLSNYEYEAIDDLPSIVENQIIKDELFELPEIDDQPNDDIEQLLEINDKGHDDIEQLLEIGDQGHDDMGQLFEIGGQGHGENGHLSHQEHDDNGPAMVQINEEAALMELLKFMYNINLTVTTAPTVLDVLAAAKKFEVASCIKHCGHLLRNLPMTPESVLVYLHLPSSILTSKTFQPLTIAAKQFYAVHYKDITKFQDEILGLPLADVETIIASDDLQVASEDDVFYFVIKWAQTHYPNKQNRHEIIATLQS